VERGMWQSAAGKQTDQAVLPPAKVVASVPPAGVTYAGDPTVPIKIAAGSRPARRRLLVAGAALAVVLVGGGVTYAVYQGNEGETGAAIPPVATTGPSVTPSPTIPADEQCTDEIMDNPRWVCLTSAVIADGKITIKYKYDYDGSKPNINTGYHVHIFGSDGKNPPDYTMSSHVPKSTRGKYYYEDRRPSVLDLKDSRFYNKPGATRAQYDKDWQECRLIARGSRTPAGAVPVYNPAMYNPAISPIASAAGGFLGGLIAGAIAEGAQRRENRKNCLLIRGWRLVQVPDAQAALVASMSDADRNNYLNQIVGAQSVDGKITKMDTFSLPAAAVGDLSAAVQGPETVFLGKKGDTAPVQLAANEAAVVLAYRRTSASNAGKFVQLALTRYDPAAGEVVYQPRDWKKKGDKTTYAKQVPSGDRHSGLEVQVVKLTPGDYVIDGAAVGSNVITSTNCFGAPTFHVSAGEVLYLGDFVPVWGAPGDDGKKPFGLGYASRIDDSRRLLLGSQPVLAAALRPAALRNRATYACSAVTMTRWDLPGVPNVQPIVAAGSATSSGQR